MGQLSEIIGFPSLLSAKLLIYVLTSSILKVHPAYFTPKAIDALASAQYELVQGLKDLDESVTMDDLMIAIFSKERLH